MEQFCDNRFLHERTIQKAKFDKIILRTIDFHSSHIYFCLNYEDTEYFSKLISIDHIEWTPLKCYLDSISLILDLKNLRMLLSNGYLLSLTYAFSTDIFDIGVGSVLIFLNTYVLVTYHLFISAWNKF